jgi:hypothetical protein
MCSKKHLFIQEVAEEAYVDVVFTNLIKKSKTDNKKEQTLDSNFEQSAVIVNGKTYYFSINSLKEKEPFSNLLDIRSGNLKKRVNERNLLIEYMEQIPDFNLVIDYINGYDYKDFGKVFKNDYSKLEHFRMLLSKLEMTNLISKMNSLYPILNINCIWITISIIFISELEPSHKLFKDSIWISNSVYPHFRDRDIFNEYFRDYLLGKKTRSDAAEYINNLHQNEHGKDYILAKINSDLDYYGFTELKKHINQNL